MAEEGFLPGTLPGWGSIWEEVHEVTGRLDGDFWRRLHEETPQKAGRWEEEEPAEEDGEWPPYGLNEESLAKSFFRRLKGFDEAGLEEAFYGSPRLLGEVRGSLAGQETEFRSAFESCFWEWILAENAVSASGGAVRPCCDVFLEAEEADAWLGAGARRYVKVLQGTRLSLYEIQAVDPQQSRVLVADLLHPQQSPEWIGWKCGVEPVLRWDISALRLVDGEGGRQCAFGKLRMPRANGLHVLGRLQGRLKQALRKGEDPSPGQSRAVAQEWLASALGCLRFARRNAAGAGLELPASRSTDDLLSVSDTLGVGSWPRLQAAFERCPDIVPVSGNGSGGDGPGGDGAGRWILLGQNQGESYRKALLQRTETGLELRSIGTADAMDNLKRLQELTGLPLKPAFRKAFPLDRQRTLAGLCEGWCGEPNPYLGGRTPRKAACLKTWRPVVERLVKDMENWTAFAARCGWMTPCELGFLRRELGLAAEVPDQA